MAISKVQNLASILSNNALTNGKIDNGFGMFEAPPSNCTANNRCGEYDPWSYDLLGRNSNNKAILEEEESQDLNNSMVNDLVAKILDDEPMTSEDTCSNRYNGNSHFYNDPQSSRMLKGRNVTSGHSNHHDEIGGSQIYYPYNKITSVVGNQDDNQHEYANMCCTLNNMTLNDCIAQTLDKSNDYANLITSNAHRTFLLEQQQQQQQQQQHQQQQQQQQSQQQSRVRSSNDVLSGQSRNYPSNGLLTTTNGINCSPNWSDNNMTHDYSKDIFGNYQHIQNSPNHDMNFNTVSRNEMELHASIAGTLTPNHYNNQALNIPDTYVTNGQQNYRHGSTINELSGDSVFSANSPLQHYSGSENALQIANNYTRNNYDDYKDIQDTGGMNMSNISMHNETLYLQQQQQQQLQQQNSYKLDRQMDQNYKALMNRFLSINDFNLPPTSDMCPSDCNPMAVNHNRTIDSGLLKVLSPKSKNRDVQSAKLRCYPRNTGSSQCHGDQQITNKYNYQINNGYQRYTASNSESLKATSQNASHYGTIKRNGNNNNNNNAANLAAVQCAYKIDPYDLTNEIAFNGGNQLAQQIARASIDNNVFNQLMKQRHQQIQRMSGVPGAGVLLNARLMRAAGNPNAGTTAATVFPSVMPIVQVPVAPIHPMSVLFGGLSIRNGSRSVRRAGPSSVLHMRLEQTFEQFKQLEKERKKCEAGLADHFPGKRVSSANNIPTPRLQGNSSRADRLIVDHFQEHARVITLIAKMEHLRGATMSERIHKAMEYWLEAIKYVQECRKKEIEYANMRRKENPECIPINDDKHVLALASSIHQLTKASRMARTGMFNALQSTLLHDGELERTVIEKSIDPIVPLAQNDVQSSANGEIGKIAKST